MKLIIAGSRNLTLAPEEIFKEIRKHKLIPTEIVCGEARGIDKCGKQFAERIALPVKSFPAKWDELGRGAGHIRNREMAEYADALLLIWDGKSKGSASMKKYMSKLGKPIYEKVIT